MLPSQLGHVIRMTTKGLKAAWSSARNEGSYARPGDKARIERRHPVVGMHASPNHRPLERSHLHEEDHIHCSIRPAASNIYSIYFLLVHCLWVIWVLFRPVRSDLFSGCDPYRAFLFRSNVIHELFESAS